MDNLLNYNDDSVCPDSIGPELLALAQSLNEMQKHSDYVERKFQQEHAKEQSAQRQQNEWRESKQSLNWRKS